MLTTFDTSGITETENYNVITVENLTELYKTEQGRQIILIIYLLKYIQV